MELSLATIFALTLGFLAGGLAENLAMDILEHYLEQEGYYEKKTEDSLESLNAYIARNHVTEDNIEQLYSWVQKEKDIYAMFYRDFDMLYSPYENSGAYVLGEAPYYEVELADGTMITVELECFVEGGYFYALDIIFFLVSVVCFVLLLFAYLNKKIRYTHLLEQELKILGDGNLDYEVTVNGNDELTGLAEGIDFMRKSIREEQKMKDEAEQANIELVTAMSHDLRTPLTSLIGYLELLNMHRYEGEEQLRQYLGNCKEKAFQIRKISDRLFEYFLVYGKQEIPYQLKVLSVEELLENICNNQFLEWQEQGGTLSCRVETLTGNVEIDGEQFQRVMDNLLSNLKKYADPAAPLRIHAREGQDMLHILFTNSVREQKSRLERTQIGLKTCRKILAKHGGEFSWEERNGEFTVELKLPLKQG